MLIFIQEEACIDAPLQHAGSLLFVTKGAEWAFQIEVFSARTYSGTPTEQVLFYMCDRGITNGWNPGQTKCDPNGFHSNQQCLWCLTQMRMYYLSRMNRCGMTTFTGYPFWRRGGNLLVELIL